MSRTFYKACLYVFIGNSMITKTILRLFTYVNGKGPTYKRATHFYLAWKEGKSHLFLIYIKLLYLPVFQFKMKPPWTVGLHGNGVLAKQVHWFGGKWCSYLMQVESSSLLEKSFKHKASHGQEKELSHAATFPAMPASGVKCLTHKKIDSSCSGQISFPTDDPQLSSSVWETDCTGTAAVSLPNDHPTVWQQRLKEGKKQS